MNDSIIMSPKERFLTALNKKTPDRVPIFEFPFSQKLQEILIGYKTVLYDGAAVVKMADRLGIDGVPVFLGGYCGVEFFETKDDRFTDDWGILYERKGWPITSQIKNPVSGRNDWQNYKMPNPGQKWRFKQLNDAIEANSQQRAIVSCIRGPVSFMSWFLLSIDNLSIAFVDDPALVDSICNSFIDWSLELAGRAAVIKGFDAFLIADDWGMSKSLLISPAYLRRFFIGPYKRLVDGIKSLGFPVIMHNDGNIWEVLDDIAAIGVDAYHPVEKAATMDLKTIKQRYTGILCPIGNIDNKEILVNGSVDDVKKEALRCLREGSENGGYIISSDHSLHDDMPVENVIAYTETVKKFGKYYDGKLKL
ncbi:MAG: hypothetical protein FJW68_10745 [Actinobacteria bacterium]|nr:hypothetical protein [Actinomycetota bacterium]